MNQLAVIGIILSCIGLAVCFGGENLPVSSSEILKHASNSRVKRQATLLNVLQCAGVFAEI